MKQPEPIAGESAAGWSASSELDLARTRAVMSALRHRAGGTPMYGATEAYGVALLVAMLSSIGLYAVARALTASVVDAGGGRGWAGYVVAWCVSCGLLRACLAIGPAFSGRDLARWVLPTTLERGVILQRPLLRTAGAAAFVGAFGGLLVVVVAHPVGGGVLVAGAVGGALFGALVHQAALAVQRFSPRPSRWAAFAGVGCVGGVMVLAGGFRVGVAVQPPQPATSWAVAVFSLVTVLLVGALSRTRSWARGLSVASLLRGGELVAALARAPVTMDGEGFELLAGRRLLRRRAWYASAVLGAGGVLAAFLRSDVIGCWRRVREIAWRVALAPFAWVVGYLFGSIPAAIAVLVVTLASAGAAALKLKLWLGSSSLWRTVPTPTMAVTAIYCVMPLTIAIVTACLAGLGAGLPSACAVACAFAAMAGVLRRTYRPPLQFGPMIDSGMGAPIPAQLVTGAVYGPDLCLGIVALGLLAGWPLAAVCALGAFAWTLVVAQPGGTRRKIWSNRI